MSVAALVLVFTKIENEDQAKYDNFYSSSKAEIIISKGDIDHVFKSIYATIITDIQNIQEKVQDGLLIQSLIILLVFQSLIFQLEAVSISNCNPLSGSSLLNYQENSIIQEKV